MSKNKQLIMISLVLTIATLMAFWQVTTSDFNNYDDAFYITKNSRVQDGISLDGIRWAFTTGHAANWHPLTWISHMLDVQFFGLEPRWHHGTNLLFHLANTVLLFFVLYRMSNARWESAFVAALFALHPLHVESVAFVAERKDVLSTFFLLLTMGAYHTYVERPGLQRYLLVVLFFALGLMAKPMVVTLPFVLLLLDYWPLRRFQQKRSDQKIMTAVNKPASGNERKGRSKKKYAAREEVKAELPADSRFQWALIGPLLREKIPLFALTVLSSIVTYIVQEKGGTVQPWPLSVRIPNAFVSYVTYIEKTIWPNALAVFYPYPLSLSMWQVMGAVLLLTTVTVTVIWKARRIPYVAMGWLWYVGTLVPVIGIVQVGMQSRADRYTYVPLIGLFIMVAWGISELSQKWRYRKEVLITSSTIVLVCLCMVTWIQVGYWQNSITLFEHALNVTKHNYVAHVNRGTAYQTLGNDKLAIEDYDKAVEIKPNDEDAYFNRATAYQHLGNLRQAIQDYDRTIEINPRNAKAYHNRGAAYSSLDNYQKAVLDYDKAIELNPDEAEGYYSRGYNYMRLGIKEQASEDLKTAARLGHRNAQGILQSQGMRW